MRSNAIRSLTLLTATVATAAAESTVSLFLPYVDTQSLVAEVLGSQMEHAADILNSNVAFGCNLGGTTSISCLVSQTDSTTTHVTATAMITDIGSFFLPVVVTGTATAGAHATTGASVTGATPSATGQTTLATSGPSVTSGPQATGSSASASATPSHSSSGNAAIPQITGNANWAIGGAAMAMALALA
ncbi:hypothetical protein ACP6JD_003035 [Aspergillus fumigatus]